MVKMLTDLIDYFKKILLMLIVICVVVFAISAIFNYILSNVFFYSGLVCFLAAGGAIVGSNDTRNFHAESVSKRTFLEASKDSFRLRNNFGFFIFMTLTGIILLIISSISGNYGF